MEVTGGGEYVVGCRLAIKTTFGEDIEGAVLAYDNSSKIVVIQEGSSGPRQNLRFLKVNYVKDVTLLGQVEEQFELKTPYLDMTSLQNREEAAIRQAEAEAERFGVGVTQEAQDIFDALSKTLPVRWEKTAILVMNEVRVSHPYLPDDVIGGPPAANERVRKVLELERKRLHSRVNG
ncbi:hypothetical protein CY35_10G054700 [Sphagnum magellanicum]|nr:hypothetical protein CY35_10G054700 [Sphagnum magellanicum]KAH9550088.1 hypothetical protein CY35_10G054700 [Sphagnum magellanicum]KAH9550089.1 hypothetical protein CY35_10G054700 [Sphagnum magellanicum]KAH9550090.1 hypothetical protein CY35_10G054700 [Sphagnum magellanicum]